MDKHPGAMAGVLIGPLKVVKNSNCKVAFYIYAFIYYFETRRYNTMNKYQFADTDAMISEMCLGCLGFGTKNDKISSYAILDYFIDRGGNFLDTANNYAFWHDGGKGGESEELLGDWIHERKNREKLFLATKVGAFPKDRDQLVANQGTREGWLNNSEGLSRKTILNAVDKSLQRLKTDYIDLCYAHIDHRGNPLEETLEAFDSLVQKGKVRYIGCSNHKPWRIEQARNISSSKGFARYRAIQQFHTYLQPKPGSFTHGILEYADDNLMDYCREHDDIALLAYTPLLWGMYTVTECRKEIPQWNNNYNTPENMDRLKALETVASETGSTINQIIYAWMIQGSPKIIPLVAVSRMEHLKENLDAVNINLTKEQMDYLNKTCC
jgi:aryl-alcohol dehydrogenase-like predicted oxidoreductase